MQVRRPLPGRPDAAAARPTAAAAVVLLLAALPLSGACAKAPARRLPLHAAGLVPARQAPPAPARTRLARVTAQLLAVIERETGERPALEADGDATFPAADAARPRAAEWSAERAALAHELVRAIDTREGDAGTVRRARAALRWDLLLGARWNEVDRRIVTDALARADAALAPLERPPPQVKAEPLLAWPVEPVRVTSRFGFRMDPLGEGARRHAGIDLAAAEGQAVRTAGPGRVVFAGRRGDYGLHVEVRHDNELVTRYAHLSQVLVRAGDRVDLGDLLGRAGATGRCTGPHLHFELWRDGLPIDPEDLLEGAGAVLRAASR